MLKGLPYSPLQLTVSLWKSFEIKLNEILEAKFRFGTNTLVMMKGFMLLAVDLLIGTTHDFHNQIIYESFNVALSWKPRHNYQQFENVQ